MSRRVVRYVLDRHPGRRGEAIECRRSRVTPDKRIWLYRYRRAAASDSTRMPGAGFRSRFHRDPTLERRLWQVVEIEVVEDRSAANITRPHQPARRQLDRKASLLIYATLAFPEQRSPAPRATLRSIDTRDYQSRSKAPTETPEHTRACSALENSCQHSERRLSRSGATRMGRSSPR